MRMIYSDFFLQYRKHFKGGKRSLLLCCSCTETTLTPIWLRVMITMIIMMMLNQVRSSKASSLTLLCNSISLQIRSERCIISWLALPTLNLRLSFVILYAHKHGLVSCALFIFSQLNTSQATERVRWSPSFTSNYIYIDTELLVIKLVPHIYRCLFFAFPYFLPWFCESLNWSTSIYKSTPGSLRSHEIHLELISCLRALRRLKSIKPLPLFMISRYKAKK